MGIAKRTGRVEKTEGIGLITNHDSYRIIVKHLVEPGQQYLDV